MTIFVSRKTAREISTESRHIEFPAAPNHEFDPAALEFYPQPCELPMELIDDATGEIHPILGFRWREAPRDWLTEHVAS